MISAFCIFLNISILTVPGYRTIMTLNQIHSCYSSQQTRTEQHLPGKWCFICCSGLSSLTFAPWALDEKIDEVQQCQVSVLFVWFDPLVHHRLYTHIKKKNTSEDVSLPTGKCSSQIPTCYKGQKQVSYNRSTGAKTIMLLIPNGQRQHSLSLIIKNPQYRTVKPESNTDFQKETPCEI